MTRRTALAITLVLGVLALGGCTTKLVTSDAATPLNTVTASGTGEASEAPDEAEMSFGITTRSEKADDALDQASNAADKIIAAVKKAGVEGEDVQTQNVSVYPEYREQTEGKAPVISDYTASISVRAKIRDIEKVGDVIAAASGAGANQISGPAFTLSDQSPTRDVAIEKAIEDAKHRGEVMAKAAGKSLGAIISVSEAGVSAIPYYSRDSLAGDAAQAVAIEPGQLDVTANVTVVFELK